MEARELDSTPSLAPLYAKAALGPVIPGRGDELPAEALGVEGVRVDPERVADYCRVCAFPVRDELPGTFPHVLAFPVAMQLMTQRSFPFRLLGLVHVANRIERLRPLDRAAPMSLRVWAENLRPHHRGRQLDIVAEATLDGELAWRGRSTYLRRGGGSGGAAAEGGAEPAEGAGTDAVWKVPGDIGRRYAEVSGDRNPIHLHPLSARLFGFPRAIAHGMWTKARCLAAFEGRLPDAYAVEVDFRAPLAIPARAVLHSREAEGGWELRLDSGGGERTHLSGTLTAL